MMSPQDVVVQPSIRREWSKGVAVDEAGHGRERLILLTSHSLYSSPIAPTDFSDAP